MRKASNNRIKRMQSKPRRAKKQSNPQYLESIEAARITAGTELTLDYSLPVRKLKGPQFNGKFTAGSINISRKELDRRASPSDGSISSVPSKHPPRCHNKPMRRGMTRAVTLQTPPTKKTLSYEQLLVNKFETFAARNQDVNMPVDYSKPDAVVLARHNPDRAETRKANKRKRPYVRKEYRDGKVVRLKE